MKYLILFFILTSLSAVAQKQSATCSIDLTYSERQALYESYQSWQATMSKSAHGRTEEVQYTLPVVFHLIEGSEKITNNQLEALLAETNDALAHRGGYADSPLGFDTNIQLCLARTSPDGGTTSGVNRIISDYDAFDMDLEDAKLKMNLQWDPRHYINVWVVDEINSEIISDYTGSKWWTRVPAGGYATLPLSVITEDYFRDGIVISALGPSLFVHELGHYLGLLHTFSSTCTNDNCELDGDMICDTPPDIEIFNSCEYNSCNTDTLSNYSNNHFFEDVNDMGSNFMDYGNGACKNDFTQGQINRMHFSLDNFRTELSLESGNEVCSMPCDISLEIDINQSILKPDVGDSVLFNSNFSGVDSFSWYVDRLGDYTEYYSTALTTGFSPESGSLSDSSSLAYHFTETGMYRIYVKGWNEDSPECFTSNYQVVRVDCGVDARYYPDKRFIASKLPIERFTEPVNFYNRSTGADSYRWKVTHDDNIPDRSDLPDSISDVTDLHYLFTEPGTYTISFEASSGDCVDVAESFVLPVADPTIDGVPDIYKFVCAGLDSVQLSFIMYNYGYDTINAGTPISFYFENPTVTNSQPFHTYELDTIVYGFEETLFSIMLDTVLTDSLTVFAAFNDIGSAHPIFFPKPDLNVLSTETEYPESGYAELRYDNNYSTYTGYSLGLLYQHGNLYACEDDEVILSFDFSEQVSWESTLLGDLGSDNPITYGQLQSNDSIQLRWETELGCFYSEDFLLQISQPQFEVDTSYYLVPIGESVTIITSGEGEEFAWIPDTYVNDPTLASPTSRPFSNIDYIVTAWDSIGCETSDSVRVEIITSAVIPDLFTPNNDGKNDILRIYGLQGVQNIDFEIYDRVGHLVFQSESESGLSAQGWNGKSNNKEVSSGVYFWKVEGVYENGLPIKLNGSDQGVVHLVR